jgi:hypothetical protein
MSDPAKILEEVLGEADALIRRLLEEGTAWRASDRRRFYAVLHLGGIRSPLDAVRAAIAAEQRS